MPQAGSSWLIPLILTGFWAQLHHSKSQQNLTKLKYIVSSYDVMSNNFNAKIDMKMQIMMRLLWTDRVYKKCHMKVYNWSKSLVLIFKSFWSCPRNQHVLQADIQYIHMGRCHQEVPRTESIRTPRHHQKSHGASGAEELLERNFR